MYMLAV